MWKNILTKNIPNLEYVLFGSLLPFIDEKPNQKFIEKKHINSFVGYKKVIEILCEKNWLIDSGDIFIVGEKDLYFYEQFKKTDIELPSLLKDILLEYFDYLKSARKENLIILFEARLQNIFNNVKTGNFAVSDLIDYLNLCLAAYNQHSNIAPRKPEVKEKAVAVNLLKKADGESLINIIPFFVCRYCPESGDKFTSKNIYTLYYKFDQVITQKRSW